MSLSWRDWLIKRLETACFVHVGTSAGRVARHFCLTHDLFAVSGEAQPAARGQPVGNGGQGSGKPDINLRLVDLGPELQKVVCVLAKDTNRITWMSLGQELSVGAARVPDKARKYYLEHRKDPGGRGIPDTWPAANEGALTIIVGSLSGGNGGGITPVIATDAPRGTVLVGIINGGLSKAAIQRTSYCYNLPIMNLGIGAATALWKQYVPTASAAGAPAQGSDRYYDTLVLFEPNAVVSFLARAAVSVEAYWSGIKDGLRQRIEERCSLWKLREDDVVDQEAWQQDWVLCNEFMARFMEMLVTCCEDYKNFKIAGPASGLFPQARYAVPCFWPIATSYEVGREFMDERPSLVDKVLRAVKVGALCEGTNPEEATAAHVLVQGPESYLTTASKGAVQKALASLLGIPVSRIEVTQVSTDHLEARERDRFRTCVLLYSPSYNTMRDLYDKRLLALADLKTGVDMWKTEVSDTELPTAEEILNHYQQWYRDTKQKAEQIQKERFVDETGERIVREDRGWGNPPSKWWTELVEREWKAIQSESTRPAGTDTAGRDREPASEALLTKAAKRDWDGVR